jgi:hypothetical protein
MQRAEIRRRLTAIQIDPSRILDITLPSRKVVGLLIHVGYKEQLMTILARAEVTAIPFNPTDSSHLQDPSLSHLSPAQRQAKALAVHRERTLRSLAYIRDSARPSVGRFFVEKEWITTEDYATVLTATTQKTVTMNGAAFRPPSNDSQPMDTMDFIASSASDDDIEL